MSQEEQLALFSVSEVSPKCIVCKKRPQFGPGSLGLGGAICLVCYYDL